MELPSNADEVCGVVSLQVDVQIVSSLEDCNPEGLSEALKAVAKSRQ